MEPFVRRLLPYVAEARRHGLDRGVTLDFVEVFAGSLCDFRGLAQSVESHSPSINRLPVTGRPTNLVDRLS